MALRITSKARECCWMSWRRDGEGSKSSFRITGGHILHIYMSIKTLIGFDSLCHPWQEP
ncbi:hypothetical protein Mapa_005137 [Marchantia paleacea]|nr:hypothetical protein Mapa_005137 [Marchantia paleacea]